MEGSKGELEEEVEMETQRHNSQEETRLMEASNKGQVISQRVSADVELCDPNQEAQPVEPDSGVSAATYNKA